MKSTLYKDYLTRLEEAEGIDRKEGNTSRAFSQLLEETARPHGLKLATQYTVRLERQKRHILLDGALIRDDELLIGCWEAKDSRDDLDHEIEKKLAAGYPAENIVFEDTRRAVLIQNGKRYEPIDLRADRDGLSDLLERFYSYQPPDVKKFDAAVTRFSERIPKLAGELKALIDKESHDNDTFKAALNKFHAICSKALNPNISLDSVIDMLVQHLMTERLMRNVFQRSDFTRRNVIAREIENIIDVLAGRYSSRDDLLVDMADFYVAVENAAENLVDFDKKQRFINTVYERFFQGYSKKDADKYGVVYTPAPIVDFMSAAIEEALDKYFGGKKLTDPYVTLLDPCTGTGNFIVRLLRRLHDHGAGPDALRTMYTERLFANEIMLMPYYVASLNIENTYRELTQRHEAFTGLCLVDTLELYERSDQKSYFDMVDENTAYVQRERRAPITVIIGNPPYNANQGDENANNKNRRYKGLQDQVKKTYGRDSSASNKNALADPYVKFFRWATDRLGAEGGIVCYVSNNSFIDGRAMDGMRKHLLQDYDILYHLDLHGNIRQNPKLSGTKHNVFGIQVGVGITLAIRLPQRTEKPVMLYYRVPEFWTKDEKLTWLADVIKPNEGEEPHPPAPSPLHGEGEAALNTNRDGESREATALNSNRDEESREAAALNSNREGETWRGKLNGKRSAPPEIWENLKPLARQMRHEPTSAENRLWQQIRNRQIVGAKFRRQHSIERFIVDFYCAEAALIVEVDGDIHQYTSEEDALRQQWLEAIGFRVVRFTNDDVLHQTQNVIAALETALKAQPQELPSAPMTPPLHAMERGPGGEVVHPMSVAGGEVLSNVPWQPLTPDAKHNWLTAGGTDEFATLISIGSKATKSQKGTGDVEAIFKVYSNGVKTHRDDVVYDFDREKLTAEIRTFIDNYNGEVGRYQRTPVKPDIDAFVNYDRIKWSRDLKLDLQRGRYADFDESKIRTSLYRPFCKQHLYFDRILNEEVYVFPRIFPTLQTEQENRVICIVAAGNKSAFHCLMTKSIVDLHFTGDSQCFPLYSYDEDGSNRRDNITDWALSQFRARYGDETITKADIFYYVYGMLHHPEYRRKFADVLKRELPRLPFVGEDTDAKSPLQPVERGFRGEVFWQFVEAGRKLADLHVNYETAAPYPLEAHYAPNAPAREVYRVKDKMRLDKTRTVVTVNPHLSLRGVPPEAFAYKLGSLSALEWVLERYAVKKDGETVTSDPNRWRTSVNDDGERYIVELVKRVVTVSVETVKIVAALPAAFGVDLTP